MKGEKGDPLVLVLFAMGQHPAQEAALSEHLSSAKLFAFLDTCIVCKPGPVITGSRSRTSWAHTWATVDHVVGNWS